MPSKPIWTRDTIRTAIQRFVTEQGRVPDYPDFNQCTGGLPSRTSVERHWSSWRAAVQDAGCVPPVPRPKRKPGLAARRTHSLLIRR